MYLYEKASARAFVAPYCKVSTPSTVMTTGSVVPT